MTDRTETTINMTLQHLNSIISGILIAQKRGVYTLDESGQLAEPVRVVSEFIKTSIKANEKKLNEQNTVKNNETNENNVNIGDGNAKCI